MKILQLRVMKSVLFGDLVIDFSRKMTCIMGGRGTGKTTILTLVKWCLSDDTLFTKSELNLIKSNLGSGTVEVDIEINAKKYTFIKSWGDEARIKDQFDNLVNNVEEVFPSKIIDFFSSGSIEQIGTDPSHRIKIIDGAVGSKIDEVNRSINILRAEIEKNQSELFYSREEYKKLNLEISQLGNVEIQLKEAQEALSKNTSNEKEKEEFDAGIEKQKNRRMENVDLSEALAIVTLVGEETMNYSFFLRDKVQALKACKQSNNEVINSWIDTASGLIDKTATNVGAAVFETDNLKNKLQAVAKDISDGHKAAELEFAEIRKKLESNRELYQKVATLNDAVTKLSVWKGKLNDIIEKGKFLAALRSQMLTKLQNLYYEKTQNRVILAEKLNHQIGDEIKIAVTPFGDKTNFESFIREVIGLGKMKVTNEHLLWELSTPNEFLQAINENRIAELAKQLNLSEERLETISRVIQIHEKKYILETIICDDLVNFYLRLGSEKNAEYKPTEYLSLGQRCTTVLPILFSISEIPLIIDQPEDNLDNRFVAETIHHIIKTTKEIRQLTFVTHNPNIPVVADSEHNVFIDYNDGKSTVSATGNVDAVKDSIVSLLEGGREAFRQRKICYGIAD